ncbi:hypothetical protein, partial [Amycolatopsis mediterranei]|uniref:hypothetical protein n=1 Tax=Amycolatopsis mediterranei TaxID=33910 RepID=UPI00332B6984
GSNELTVTADCRYMNTGEVPERADAGVDVLRAQAGPGGDGERGTVVTTPAQRITGVPRP